MTLSAWMRAIRVRFLLASVLSVAAGLAAAAWRGYEINTDSALLTVTGVLFLHASVDLLNDYHDYSRGIDSKTSRTGLSGGTGVLPEGLLEPSHVRIAGIIFLAAGAAIGAYFVVLHGMVIAAILGFAVLSIYFYSGRIVDTGMAELFVGIKGALIVVGTYYLQAGSADLTAVLAGISMGVLSSLVLFVTSFPDHDADKAGGRRTLVILLGSARAAGLFWLFPAIFYGTVAAGAAFSVLPIHILGCILGIPLAVSSARLLQKMHASPSGMISVMRRTLLYGRVSGALIVAGLVIGAWGLYL